MSDSGRPAPPPSRPTADASRTTTDAFLEATRAVLCAPIRAGDDLIGFATLSADLRGARYGTDDCDLLRAIASHAGMLLAHARLADERRAAAELEALHRFSAFCLHDLKNLAAGLSLVVQNAEVHGQDPAFQKSAMRTVVGTVRKMMGLMAKLSLKPSDVSTPDLVDLPGMITDTVGSLAPGLRVRIHTATDPVPPVRAIRDQLQQVLLNVILNARQATGEGGEVRIATERVNGSVAVTVTDNGDGMGSKDLREIFRPFRTTKPGGLGLGLYQCKRIIEAHRGRIRVTSEAGQGTKVRIELPIHPVTSNE